MKYANSAARLVRDCCAQSDRFIVNFLVSHANLITALATLGLAVWGLSLGHLFFFLGLIAIGALSYFFGMTLGLSVGVILGLTRLLHPVPDTPLVTIVIVELVGYICIAWLGFRHKEQKQRQRVHEHTDQVLPWAVANEVRTSLAAVRFLLFPLHDERTSDQLETVTRELSRLENIFSEIEGRQERQERLEKQERQERKQKLQ
ncbi:MAG: hypothetical protein A2201_03085 [Alicyclobacillus sp. RIFOXYA1_FULL_53_8]|nr:MAG: hypothetical protein A2201_03085 [Alicyclobacillus sp. RIFOXYA1_FULL_53_8]